jgi:hypothetical protein
MLYTDIYLKTHGFQMTGGEQSVGNILLLRRIQEKKQPKNYLAKKQAKRLWRDILKRNFNYSSI